MTLLDPLFRWPAVDAHLGDAARVQGMLDFEAALARALVRAGVAPPAVAVAVPACCRAERFDLEALARETAPAGNPLIPLVRRLTDLVAADDPEAARFVHWGATSQDAMDTGVVLQLRGAIDLLDAELGRLADALARLADEHRGTPMAGRTWLQHALPTTFGLEAAGWLAAVERDRTRLRDVHTRISVVQLGGAVGTLASLGGHAAAVEGALAAELGLGVPELPWHTHRDRMAETATALGLATGTLAKIARDIALHAQTEIAELEEPWHEGRGGSSTLPHKRNPVACAVVLAAGVRVPGLVATMLLAMDQEHARGLGGWHAEWETLPEIVSLFGGALHHLTDAVCGLRVDPARMRENLERTRGLVFAEAVQTALAAAVGRGQAHGIVEAASHRVRAEGRHLEDVLAADEAVTRHLPAERLAALFDPMAYLGAADAFVARVLAARHRPSHD